MAARLVRSKGVAIFAEAAGKLPDLYFLLVGPQDFNSLDALSAQEIAALAPRLHWLGARSDIEKIMAIADIFVLPSGREGIPRVLVEAGAMELPLIATNLPGCREVVVDEVNGLLFEHQDVNDLARCIQTLAGNPDLRKQYGRAARLRSLARYDLTAVAAQIKAIYMQTLSKKKVITGNDGP